MRTLPVLILLGALGCSPKVSTFNLDSDPQGMIVEVSDMVVCDRTPCQVQVPCRGTRGFRGIPYMVRFTASPREAASEHPLFAQSKEVESCAGRKAPQAIFFNMGMDKVTPKARIDITSH